MGEVDAEAKNRIDEALSDWRQGDCFVGEFGFSFRIALDVPITCEAREAAAVNAEDAEAIVNGIVVLSQTCDIVRACQERPFIEVCPLVQVSAGDLNQIERCRRPNYAYISGVSDHLLVADLDRVMTVEKSVVANLDRTPGCIDDMDCRRLASALARKRARAAFPDDFVSFISPFADRLKSKHDKQSEEGKVLRALREIRVRAAPSWNSGKVEIMLWLVRHEDDLNVDDKTVADLLDYWLKLIPEYGRFETVYGQVVTLDDLTAKDYVESDRLDFDYLTTRK